MSIELDPPQLAFHRPFTTLVKETLTVINRIDQPIAFKVKTTAPKQYCVRPNSGRVEPRSSVEVQVLLQPMKEEPSPDVKCRDKFLVQSVAIAPEMETVNLSEIWSHIESSDKSAIHEKKIRCIWLPPGEEAPTAGAAGYGATNGVASSLREMATAGRKTVVPSSLSTGGAADETASTQTAPSRALSEKAAVVQPDKLNPSSSDVRDLQTQLKDAKSEIERLRGELASGMRKRNAGPDAGAGEKMSATAQNIGAMDSAGGVPLHITAGLCFFVFMFAYLFF